MGINTLKLRSHRDAEQELERGKALARQAKQFTVEALRSAERIEQHQLDRGSFFCIMAEVYVDGESLSNRLMAAGLAVSYREKAVRRGVCGMGQLSVAAFLKERPARRQVAKEFK